MNEINVAFICDENYAMPTACAITSLKKNMAETTRARVFVLAVELKKSSEKKIALLNSKKCKVEILQIELSQKQKSVVAKRERVTNAALLKFDLPNIFLQCEKILYLDSDVIVQKDLQNFYKTDISDFYVAAVKDVLTFRNKNHLAKINFQKFPYFNSGVMLLNLEKMRKDDLAKKLLDYRLEGANHFMDQDAFNVVCQGKVKFVSPYFNLLNCFFEWEKIETLSKFYDVDFPKKIELVFKNAFVLHFGDKKKPWIFNIKKFSKLYKTYYELSPYANEPLKLQSDFFAKDFFKKAKKFFARILPPSKKQISDRFDFFEASAECFFMKQNFRFLQMEKFLEEAKEKIERQEKTLFAFCNSEKNFFLQNEKKIDFFSQELNGIKETCRIIKRAALESVWGETFEAATKDSKWLKRKTFFPGRAAAGFQFLYALFRILNSKKPRSILELGMGQTTNMISQYADFEKNVFHRVVEHDKGWIDFYKKEFPVSKKTEVVCLEMKKTKYQGKYELFCYADFSKNVCDKKYDFVCIDGPFGFGCDNVYSRIDILDLIPQCLCESFVIVIDDAERKGEQNTIEIIKEKLRKSNVDFAFGKYSGQKDSAVIASGDNKFLCTL